MGCLKFHWLKMSPWFMLYRIFTLYRIAALLRNDGEPGVEPYGFAGNVMCLVDPCGKK